MCSVSYAQLALVIHPLVKKASNFKRIQRFFRQVSIFNKNYIQFVWMILHRSEITDQFILAMNRANWEFGTLNVDILIVAIIYRGTAIPLIWRLLPKASNSNQLERILLIRALRQMLSPAQ